MILGSLARALALSANRLPDMRPPLWLGVGLVPWILSLPVGAPPSPIHDCMVRLSLVVSNRAGPYSRRALHRDHRREMERRAAAQLSALAPTH